MLVFRSATVQSVRSGGKGCREVGTRSKELTQQSILDAGRALFAERGVAEVSIRDIAAAAGVSHTLVHFYFGSKKDLVGAILNREAHRLNDLAKSGAVGPADSVEGVRELMRITVTELRWVLKLQVQAGLARLEPGALVDEDVRVLGVIENWIRSHRGKPGDTEAPDPALSCAVVIAALMSFGIASPWIMTSVGLEPEDFEARLDEIIEILVSILPGTAMGHS